MPVLWPLPRNRIIRGGTPMIAAYGPGLGGIIRNPPTALAQGITSVETLYLDMNGPPLLEASRTTFAVEPGQSFTLPAFTGPIWVNSASSRHGFSGFIIQDNPNFKESEAEFPPDGPTTLTQTIPSYLYQQYQDDDDLQAFVSAYNTMAQQYVDWFVHLNLPIYTQDPVAGPLLDWVAAGLYGILRPSLPSGLTKNVGPLNTYAFNTWPLNTVRKVSSGELYTTTDDLFRRIITWHFYKGDGKVFNIRWLKRRVQRFLTGVNGTGGQTPADLPILAPDQTYQISVTFGANNEVNINVSRTRRTFVGGALLGTFAMNTRQFNEIDTTSTEFPVNPLAPVFKSAMDTGVLEVPFHYKFVVNVEI